MPLDLGASPRAVRLPQYQSPGDQARVNRAPPAGLGHLASILGAILAGEPGQKAPTPPGSASASPRVCYTDVTHMKLSKTNYLIWRHCPHNAWAKIHLPEVYHAEPLSAFDAGLIETGNEVDELARRLFPGGRLITLGDAATTARLIAERHPILYQPVFETDCYTTACDMLVWNDKASAYDLYEVKASTSNGGSHARMVDYRHDLAFQAEVLRTNQVSLGRLFLVRLDRRYERGGTLDIDALFACEDLTDDIAAVAEEVRSAMAAAHEFLSVEDEPDGPCTCLARSRSNHCTTFTHWNPHVPAYSVHDIARIGASPKKLAAFIDAGILDIRDMPDDAPLSATQMNQLRAAKSGQPTINPEAIAEFLSVLTYPLAFLDYETFAAAVPRFDGYHPFDHIPFQFSLDVIAEPDADMTHHEFLFRNNDCPDQAFIAALRTALPDRGSVIVWNKTFETNINAGLAARNPDASQFLIDLNIRIVDLADVFTSQAYVHPDFCGRTSIKAVLPVLVPKLSYKPLAIQEGASASEAWDRMVSGELSPDEVDQITQNLLAYCALDTQAMVEICRVLEGYSHL